MLEWLHLVVYIGLFVCGYALILWFNPASELLVHLTAYVVPEDGPGGVHRENLETFVTTKQAGHSDAKNETIAASKVRKQFVRVYVI